ncbi:MAG TPA: ABC transporter permease [Candidatus Acidoferrales bacterium]|nr:ABC transporter permease [Candidatus Acidoferrales bacterium]
MAPINWLSEFGRRMAMFFRREKFDREMDEEIRAHVASRERELRAAGLSSRAAYTEAQKNFGNPTVLREASHDAWGWRWLEQFAQDLRYAFRMLRKSPAFTAVAVLTLALGIGANTAIFSVVDATLLRPLPYPDSSRLAILFSSLGNEHRAPASGYEYDQIRRDSRLFEQIGGIWVTNASIPGVDDPQPEPVKLAQVTDGFLPLFCARPALGRFFTPQDAAPSNSIAIVISNGFWRRRFGSDSSIVGKSLHIGYFALTILGVLPEDFHLIFPDDSSVPATPDVYSLVAGRVMQPGGPAFLRLVGRIRPGANFAQAQSEADGIAEQFRATMKGYSDQNYHLRVVPLQQEDVRNVRSTLVVLFGGVGFVLLIGCANVANLLLARAGNRERETIVRAALGATRGRIIRQLLTESILLGFFGGLAAIAVGWAALRGLLALRPESLLRLGIIHLDARAFAFTLVVALITGIIFGFAPALGASRFDLAAGLKSAGRNPSSARRGSKTVLILGEVALSFALLTGTGLLVRTFINVLHVDPGFQAANVLGFSVLGGDYNFLHQLQQNLASLSGVESVSLVSHLPLDNSYPNWYDYYWPQGTPPDQQSTAMADNRSVLPGYFKTIGATMIEGRDFTDVDDAAHQHVAIVDDVLAQLAWPGQDPIGKKLHVSDSPAGPYQFQDDWVVVVGVVRHVQYHSLTVMLRPQIYLPYQLAPRPVSFVLRAAAPLPSMIGPIRQEVSKLNKNVAIARFIPLSDLIAQARSQTRFVTYLAGTLAALALFLSCIGIYGVTSYLVMSRTPEIGIRMALGAIPADVRKLVLVRGMAPVILGCLIGIALSLPLTPLLSTLLFGVRPIDTPTFVAVAILLSIVGFLSCYIPARRAVRVDPMVALRYE